MNGIMQTTIQPGTIYEIDFPIKDVTEQTILALAVSMINADGYAKFVRVTRQGDGKETDSVSLTPEYYQGEGLNDAYQLCPGQVHSLSQASVLSPVAELKPIVFHDFIRLLVRIDVAHYAQVTLENPRPFVAEQNPIPPSGKVIGTPELQHMVDAALDGWLTTGRFNDAFEARLAAFLGVKHVLTTNSGSSANLLAISALTSPKLKDRALRPGDEVITVAAGFPTTVNPILLYGLIPVFVDVHIPTYNIDPAQIEAAVSERTKAIMIAHTLGNPFALDEVIRIAKKYNLWLIEDCCDALGSKYRGQLVGTFGDISTLSFYPAHHITMGEGGAVFTNNDILKRIVESFRDWGRDCYCPPGRDNTCNKRFGWQLGQLPKGYDHKYTYSHIGFNLKISDMQAACALAQMDRLPGFIETRKHNFDYLKQRLDSVKDFLILPEATESSEPSWFGFPITLNESANTTRVDLLTYLNQYKIGTRLLFAGNLIRQPYFSGQTYKQQGELPNTETIMNHTFWLGVYPGLNETMLEFVAVKLEQYFGVGF
jgi:CDP-4-dehydro-6-deoxyglucose reductase, E1